MKYFYIIFTFIVIHLNGFCQISVNKNESPHKVFQIPDNIEPDAMFKGLLSKYVYECMVDNPSNLQKDSIELLVRRKSFVPVITFFVSDSSNKLNRFYESDDSWNSFKMNLITNIPSKEVMLEVVDSLLGIHCVSCSYGIMALWGNCDFNQLANYPQYRERLVTEKRTFELAELMALCWISNNKDEFLHISDVLLELDKEIYLKILSLCKQPKFDYEEMIEVLYYS